MSRALMLVLGATVAALTVGACGGSSHMHAAVSARITITSRFFGQGEVFFKSHTRSYTLTCHPTSGTLPFAARICADIAKHPQPMLDPLFARTMCVGGSDMPAVAVTATHKGTRASFSASPDCDWPDGIGAAVYFDAATHDTHALALTEPRLRCEDDPMLLAQPTPWVSVEACRHGLWTPRSERLIRIAEHLPSIASLGAHLFPTEIGARRCIIGEGGPAPGKRLHGVCQVSLTHAWSTPTVRFTESWQQQPGGPHGRATIDVKIVRGHAGLAGRHGVPPQLIS